MTKTLTALTAAIMGLSLATGALAEGSKIKGSTIANRANVKNSANVAIGVKGRAEANQASVKIKGSTVKGSTIANQANVKNSANVAVDAMGLGSIFGTNKSNQSSIVIE